MPRLAPMLFTLAVLAGAAAARAQTAWYEGFEGPETSWRDAGGDGLYQIAQHRRLAGEAHTGQGCELLRVVGNQSTTIHIAHPIGQARVIDDLMPSVWVKSDRTGLQILARVVLPRTEDPRSGRPVSTLVRGSTYTSVGRWQQLRIEDVPQLLERQVRVLRAQLGPSVDGREAYLDQILLNVYGGPGATSVWIDDLDLAGYIARQAGPEMRSVSTGSPSRSAGSNPAVVGPDRQESRRVELAGSVLMVDGRPFFPRVVRHRGEPLAFLRQLGFNAVWLDGLPAPEVLAEAERLDLWVVCPPPRAARLEGLDAEVSPLAEIGPEYDRVLAWDLGRGLTPEQLDLTRRWAEQVRAADRRRGRPLICLPDCDLRGFSRQVDLLLLQRLPLGTSLDLADYGRWIRGQSMLARLGTPTWTTVQTQPADSLRRQLAALAPGRTPPLTVADEQMALLAYTAVAAGSRGLLFQSDTPLDAADADTRRRAMALELLNLQLQLIEPWAAAGSPMAAAEGSEPELAGNVLQANRSRLLIPIWTAPGAQFVPGQSAGNHVSFVVPGVPETNRAYQLIPGGLEPPRNQQRETGGMRVTLEEFGLTGPMLFAHDPLVINSLAQRSALVGPRAAELARNLAVERLQAVRAVVAEISGSSSPTGPSAQWLATGEATLRQCDGYLAAKDYRRAYSAARRTTRPLRLVERSSWEAAVRGLSSPVSSPATVGFATLPWQRSLVQQAASFPLGPNRLAGGDFEQLPTMLDTGWRHLQYPVAGVRTAVDLVAGAAHSGGAGLRLTAGADDPARPPAVVETPPVWITTPALPVQAGQLVCIQGWVRIPAAITGSVDGLLIVDSLGGEALAQRIGQTDGWQPFVVYRAAPGPSYLSITFALSGLGEAWIDDVTICTLEPAMSGRLTQQPTGVTGPR